MKPAKGQVQMFTIGVSCIVGPRDVRQRAVLESLIRPDYERCHPGETLEDLKHRTRFSKEDQGLFRDWMTVAERHAAARHGSSQKASATG